MGKSLTKSIWIDPHTFGGSKACEVLADFLNKGEMSIVDKHKILKFINNTICFFLDVSTIEYASPRVRALDLAKADAFTRIDRMSYDLMIKSLLKNVINLHYRRFI